MAPSSRVSEENDRRCYLDKEENMKFVDGLIKWLLGMNNAEIIHPSKSVKLNDYIYS